MREPELRARFLASPPIFFGSWALALWMGYQWTQHHEAWPLLIPVGLLLAAVMKADEQMRAYKNFKREWDAMAGVPPPRKNWPHFLGIILGLILLAVLGGVAQEGGSQAVIGVLILLAAPLLFFAVLARLWRWFRHRRRAKSAQVEPVTVCVTRPLMPVPSLRDAYHGLPDHCHMLMRFTP